MLSSKWFGMLLIYSLLLSWVLLLLSKVLLLLSWILHSPHITAFARNGCSCCSSLLGERSRLGRCFGLLHMPSIRPTQLVGKLLTTQTSLASRLPWLPCSSQSRLTHCGGSKTLRPWSSPQALLLLSQAHNLLLLLLLLRALMLLRGSRVGWQWLLLSTRPTTI